MVNIEIKDFQLTLSGDIDPSIVLSFDGLTCKESADQLSLEIYKDEVLKATINPYNIDIYPADKVTGAPDVRIRLEEDIEDSKKRDLPKMLKRGMLNLTTGATINTNCGNYKIFRVKITENATLSNPTNMVDGETYKWIIKMDSTAGWNVTFGDVFDFGFPLSPDFTIISSDVITIITGLYDGLEGKLYTVYDEGFNFSE